ncbi:MAG: hypothetical protein A2675_01855 [Candidatus Yonathbacteria bacterium RIFCSPHIGHO2_01_FULL_51_10]|uniref:Peptidase M50 domain-containing protein n=1 Tax=Candidatus Yonathbacteria bacterium RIFCSPHIGHO2_01_FULL_51_10 TaxID=1802723 RepID=A0A1G2S9W8_9BACT|nr:MAG: hypothetical protein A2675_01855 [Candidatus Yonathbacteria bacterium RIFCSPHIGHO2_01_FULL_51_10]
MQADTLFYVAVLVMSVVIHEVSHGYMADVLGDRTARLAGRLTLNPIPHIDPIGSILVPLVLSITHSGFLFGWAKPVPYNPRNLSNQRWGSALVGAAGALSNLLVAFVFGMVVRFGPMYGLPPEFFAISNMIVVVNLLLAVFNLLPFPPLDGAKVLFGVLPQRFQYIEAAMEQYWMVLIIVVIFAGWQIILPVMSLLYTLFTGYAWPIGL